MNGPLMAVPQPLHTGILMPPDMAGRLFASPAFATLIFLGPVGTCGCHWPGRGDAADCAGGGGALAH